jgi:hypothetical protein
VKPGGPYVTNQFPVALATRVDHSGQHAATTQSGSHVRRPSQVVAQEDDSGYVGRCGEQRQDRGDLVTPNDHDRHVVGLVRLDPLN